MNNGIDFSNALSDLNRTLRETLRSVARPSEPQKDAIRAVFTAVDATTMHLGRLRGVQPKSYAPNPELVDLWREAAIAVAAFDSDLAIRLRRKAEFWSDPENWNADECAHAGIQLESLAESARGLLQLVVPIPYRPTRDPSEDANCFLSHASEDTTTVAEPLMRAIETQGYRVWLDRFSLKLGDSLREKIDEGLRNSRYGVVVLSPNFFAKKWPMQEVRAILALEDADGRKRLLPVWHQVDYKAVARQSPFLADRIGVSTDLGMEEVARQIIDQIRSAAA
ncbi:MAG: toll/interleukin-1 receptor domain-containing protein [Nitrospira sp.]|nr:toll/interleukin-1 receptor domain-containing protein [Nitrospira sp.]